MKHRKVGKVNPLGNANGTHVDYGVVVTLISKAQQVPGPSIGISPGIWIGEYTVIGTDFSFWKRFFGITGHTK
ncbi:MAG: hypothetical protein OXH00_16640 [Candidatus Poribacteria bacterium]|nr:hypothetical protein [Candidatus Poribacteria bacterium]